jgi:hypothetical protein
MNAVPDCAYDEKWKARTVPSRLHARVTHHLNLAAGTEVSFNDLFA